jgi:oligoribonuclease
MNDFILWLDLETTGNRDDADIIEVGAVLTDRLLVEQGEFSRVYRTRVPVSDIDPLVLKMHFDNGLWAETTKSPVFAEECEAELLSWLGKAGALKSPLPLAGSGVSHFDRRYIRRIWPRLDRRLTHWHYDIGVMRRFLVLFGSEMVADTPPVKAHRAINDARMHLREALSYRDYEWEGR